MISTSGAVLSETSAILAIDWDSAGDDAQWLGTGPMSMSGADAKYDGICTSHYPGWGSLGAPAAASVTSNAVGLASSTSSSISASGHAASNGTSAGETSASGTSHIRRDFTFLGDSNRLFVDIDYEIQQGFTATQAGETAGGYSIAELSLWDTSSQISVFEVILDNVGENASSSMTLAIEYDGFVQDIPYSLEGHVYSSAWSTCPEQELPQVPVPASMMLLGSGLAFLAGPARRKLFRRS